MKENGIRFIRPKTILLFILLLFVIPESFGQFYPVPKMKVEMKVSQTNTYEVSVGPFSISELITVKEFNLHYSPKHSIF